MLQLRIDAARVACFYNAYRHKSAFSDSSFHAQLQHNAGMLEYLQKAK